MIPRSVVKVSYDPRIPMNDEEIINNCLAILEKRLDSATLKHVRTERRGVKYPYNAAGEDRVPVGLHKARSGFLGGLLAVAAFQGSLALQASE